MIKLLTILLVAAPLYAAPIGAQFIALDTKQSIGTLKSGQEWRLDIAQQINHHFSARLGWVQLSGQWRDQTIQFKGLGLRGAYKWDPLTPFSVYHTFGADMAISRAPDRLNAIRTTLGSGVTWMISPEFDATLGVQWSQLAFTNPDESDSIWMVGAALSYTFNTKRITMSDRRQDVFYDPRLIKRRVKKGTQ